MRLVETIKSPLSVKENLTLDYEGAKVVIIVVQDRALPAAITEHKRVTKAIKGYYYIADIIAEDIQF